MTEEAVGCLLYGILIRPEMDTTCPGRGETNPPKGGNPRSDRPEGKQTKELPTAGWQRASSVQTRGSMNEDMLEIHDCISLQLSSTSSRGKGEGSARSGAPARPPTRALGVGHAHWESPQFA